MTDYSKLTDTKEARRKRQAKRREKLNEAAKNIGYDTWHKLETAVIHGSVKVTVAHRVDLNPNKKYYETGEMPKE